MTHLGLASGYFEDFIVVFYILISKLRWKVLSADIFSQEPLSAWLFLNVSEMHPFLCLNYVILPHGLTCCP